MGDEEDLRYGDVWKGATPKSPKFFDLDEKTFILYDKRQNSYPPLLYLRRNEKFSEALKNSNYNFVIKFLQAGFPIDYRTFHLRNNGRYIYDYFGEEPQTVVLEKRDISMIRLFIGYGISFSDEELEELSETSLSLLELYTYENENE
jgi:hypothetical protein